MSDEIENVNMQLRWYAVITRSRQERVAAAMLDALGVQQFLPIAAEVHQWSDRRQVVNLPLFPGYLFVRTTLSPETSLRVRKVPGVVDFVGNQSGPLFIPDGEIEDIRTVLARGASCSPHPFLCEGDRVRVVRGVLAGIEGTFVRNGSKDQLIISVELIRRSIAFNVPRQDVEAVDIPMMRAGEFAKAAHGASSLPA